IRDRNVTGVQTCALPIWNDLSNTSSITWTAVGTIAALLGASPGASTAVHVMLEVLERSFPEDIDSWKPAIKEMVPSYGLLLMEETDLLEEITEKASEALGI